MDGLGAPSKSSRIRCEMRESGVGVLDDTDGVSVG